MLHESVFVAFYFEKTETSAGSLIKN